MVHHENQSSIAVAKHTGFKEEGLLRRTRVAPQIVEGNGIPPRDGDPKSPSPGWHSALLSLCADDWETGGGELVLTFSRMSCLGENDCHRIIEKIKLQFLNMKDDGDGS
jgi:hypothetical protein